jgi:hypothetical protein
MTTNMQLNTQLAGRYKIEAFDVVTGQHRVVADWFDNVITDIGLESMATGGPIQACRVGSGSAAPLATDTQLQSQIASTSSVNSFADGSTSSSPYYRWFRRTYRFAIGAAAGNITEVGVGWGSSGATLFSRALIKDGNGTPTSITVLSTEVLDVTYELRVYVSEADTVQTINISGTNYTFTLREMYIAQAYSIASFPNAGMAYLQNYILTRAYNGPLGTLIGGPSGAFSEADRITVDNYSANSKRREITLEWGLNSGNLANFIQSFSIALTYSGVQIGVSPVIQKTASKIFRLKIAYSWARR